MYLFENVESGSGTGIYAWRIEKRDMATGTTTVLSATGGGTNYSGPGGGFLALSGSSLYVTGHDGTTSVDGQWRIEKRKTSDLSLDTTFNGSGVISFNPTTSTDEEFCEALVVTGGVLFCIGTDNGSTRRWRIESWFK